MNRQTVSRAHVCFTSDGGELPFWAIRYSKHAGRFTQSVDSAEGYSVLQQAIEVL